MVYYNCTNYKLIKFNNVYTLLMDGNVWKAYPASDYASLGIYIAAKTFEYVGVPTVDVRVGKVGDKFYILTLDKVYPGMPVLISKSDNPDEIVKSIDNDDVMQRFWTVFVLDALLGNVNAGSHSTLLYMSQDECLLRQASNFNGCMGGNIEERRVQGDIAVHNIEYTALSLPSEYMDSDYNPIKPMQYIEDHAGSNEHLQQALKLLVLELLPVLYEIIDSIDDLMSPIRNAWYKESLRVRLDKLLAIKEKYSIL